jgi:predicted nucleotidyltransferase
MRVTRETLLKLARDTVKQRVAADHNLIAAYLVGSTLRDDPFLGGATDVDIVFLTIHPPSLPREIVRLSPDVHLDLAYFESTSLEPPRKLRTDPYLGYIVYSPIVLYDTRHFFEYAQAIVRAQFDDAPNVLARVRHHSDPARRLWMELQSGVGHPRAADLLAYLQGVEHAAQAFALFDGPPLTERRFLIDFASRAPDQIESLEELVGGLAFDPAQAASLLPAWEMTFNAAAREGGDPSIHPARLNYYKHAIEALLRSQRPSASLWPLIHTWTVAATALPGYSEEVKAWQEAFSQLGLAGEGFEYRLQGLDRLLDSLEERCDTYAAQYSLEQE